jgi:uncharacterized protein (DUF362 family)
MTNDGVTRRDVLAGLLGAAAATLGHATSARAAASGKARVVRVESARVWQGKARDPKVVAAMVDRGLVAFTGLATAEEAWRQYFKPGMRVGLKINVLGRPLVYTAREVTETVAARAIAAGVKPADVIVWDRHASHFGPTVYKPGTGTLGEQIRTGGQYDAARAANCSCGAAPLDRIVAETDITVNLPVMKDHQIAGVTGALKNISFGCYGNPGPAHRNNCDPYITETYAHYLTQTKVPLAILDATECCYDGGPQPGDPDRIWRENAIYVATDPVALDAVMRQVILDKRKAAGLNDTLRSCRHIETSADKGLGVADVAAIEIIRLTV